MTLPEAKRLALLHMVLHGLNGWTFRFDNAKTRVGVCRFDERVIGLSRHYVRANDEDEVKDTILHEIAHALAGPQAGHGPRWKKIARELGCAPVRCTNASIDVHPRYTLWCTRCDTVLRHYHRQPRRDYASGRFRHTRCGGNALSLRPFEADSEPSS
jgi:predicted SprT family Zn-dependent metalloprotease